MMKIKILFANNNDVLEEITDATCHVVSKNNVKNIFQKTSQHNEFYIHEKAEFLVSEPNIKSKLQQKKEDDDSADRLNFQGFEVNQLTKRHKIKLVLAVLISFVCIVLALAANDFIHKKLFVSLTFISIMNVIRQISDNKIGKIQAL